MGLARRETALTRVGVFVLLCATVVACGDGGGSLPPTSPSSTGSTANTYISVRGDPGSWVSDGEGHEFTLDTATFTIALTTQLARIDVTPTATPTSRWTLEFEPPLNESFQVARTYETQRIGTTGRAGLNFLGNGRSCGASIGSFRIDALEFAGPTIQRLRAVFQQRCNDTQLSAPVRGEVQIITSEPGIRRF
jgi:hypothetical protein